MPSWKKVILSGSDASLNSLAVTTNVTATSFTGSLSGTASYANQAATASYVATASYIPTLDQVTTQGSTTTNNIAVGSLTSLLNGNNITGVFKTVNGSNTFIIESSGSGGVLPGLVTFELRDYSTSLNGATITYGGTDGDILSFLNEGGTRLRLSGSTLDQTYIFENGSNSGTGSFSWNNSTPFIQKIGGGTTQFLGNATTATTASYVATASYTPNLQQVTTKGNTTTNNMIITGSLNLRSNGSNINAYLRTPSSFGSGISFQDANTTAAEFVHCGALGDSFYITSGFTLNVLVDSNGNTGFKTTSPASTVDVNGDLTVRANATVTGSITNTNSGFKSMVFTSGSSIANATTNGTLFTISAGTYESVTMDYVVFDSTRTNKRAGTLRGTWDDNTSAIVFDETSTTDIGDTTAFTLDMVNNGSGTITVRATNNVGSAMTIIYEYKLLG